MGFASAIRHSNPGRFVLSARVNLIHQKKKCAENQRYSNPVSRWVAQGPGFEQLRSNKTATTIKEGKHHNLNPI